jgi:A/G-specific adenine glycosylase
MLQQTTVAAVIPFFERFLRAFPTVQALAKADDQAVLKQWEGLGYYRRAKHLHAAAKIVAAEHGGVLAGDPAIWKALPGVGRYILGAVLSQAFGLPFPIVEANTLRVLARVFGYQGNPRAGAGKRWVWAAAEAALPAERIGDFNQAMMELGALVCTPAAPKCDSCPLKRACAANRLGIQSRIPPKVKPPSSIAVKEVAVAIRNAKGLVLVGRRPAGARWAGMWEIPHGEFATGELPADAAGRVAHQAVGLRVKVGSEFARVTHVITRYVISVVGYEARAERGRPAAGFFDDLRWIEPNRLSELPASTPQRKLFASLCRTKRE